MPQSSLQQALESAGAHFRSGRLPEAEALYKQVLIQQANHAEAMHGLGLIAYQVGQAQMAVEWFSRCVEVDPSMTQAYNNLGLALQKLGLNGRAIDAFRKAVTLTPNFAEAHYNLGTAYLLERRMDQATESLQQALMLRPNHAEAVASLGTALREQGRLEEAIDCFRKGTQLNPDDSRLHGNLLASLLYHPRYTPAAIYKEYLRWAERFALPLSSQIKPHDNDRTAGRALRIGYVSPDFREHAVGRLLEPIFENHDREAHKIVCYSDVKQPGAYTQRLRANSDLWRDTAGYTDEYLAEVVRQDRIDILVDLCNHNPGSRLLVFARKPAPVQATYLGAAATTGLATMDYRLADPLMDPPDMPYYGTEQLVRLPRVYWCFEPPAGSPSVSDLPAMRNGFLTFAAFNSVTKINGEVIAIWSRILKALPDSRLTIIIGAGGGNAHIPRLFRENGVDPQRIQLAGRRPYLGFLELHNEVDVGLDPFPYNGGVTSLDSLWMGVPFVTLAGQTAIARRGAMLLSHVGLGKMIARTPDEYVDRAVGLANNLPSLRTLRSELRPRLQASALMDARQFTRDLEHAYRKMWKTWCGNG